MKDRPIALLIFCCVFLLLCSGVGVAADRPLTPSRGTGMRTNGPVPDPANSSVEWKNLSSGTTGTRALICPSGDGSYLEVTLKDNAGDPVPGALVTAGFVASCDTCACSRTEGITDGNGYVRLNIPRGLDVSGSTACCNVVTTVQSEGVTIPWKGTGGALSDSRQWLTPDLDGDCYVDALDRDLVFFIDLGTSACRSDFNCSGTVDNLDSAIFSSHWNHGCVRPGPSAAHSTVEWKSLVCSGTKALVCPGGDGSYLEVTLRDNTGSPIIGALVTGSAAASCDTCMCGLTEGTTNALGVATLLVRMGLDVSGSTACCNVVTTVQSEGVTIPWGIGEPLSDSRQWLTPDLDGDCYVDGLDSDLFNGDMGTNACRSNFDCIGNVTSLDYSIFYAHWNHGCARPGPSPLHSSVEWKNLSAGTTGTRALICPSGDGSYLEVTLKDNAGNPIVSALVTAGVAASCDTCMCSQIQGITNGSGVATLLVRMGLDMSGSTACCNVVTTVQSGGVTIPWKGTGGALSDSRQWLTPDLDGDCWVDTADSTIVVADVGTTACRSDFNCNGSVNMTDLLLFANHWHHGCPSADLSSVEWKNLQCGGKALICPDGDGSTLEVTLKDRAGNPMSDAVVTARLAASCDTCMCREVRDTTNASGVAVLSIPLGLDVSADTACCVVTTTVQCGGVTIPWKGTGGALSDTRPCLSPDMDGDCAVYAPDQSILLGDIARGTYACRSDFNCDGMVSALDLSFFMLHWYHGCTPAVGVGEGRTAPPTTTSLTQNYPNPFNPLTSIAFDVARRGRVSLRIYDIAGRPVRTLVEGWREPRHYQISWDGRDEKGSAVASGIYFYQLEAPGYDETKKLVIVR